MSGITGNYDVNFEELEEQKKREELEKDNKDFQETYLPMVKKMSMDQVKTMISRVEDDAVTINCDIECLNKQIRELNEQLEKERTALEINKLMMEPLIARQMELEDEDEIN